MNAMTLNGCVPRLRKLAAAAACLAGLAAAPALAQNSAPVHLKSTDGSISLRGQLLSYENDVYVIDVPNMGIVKIEGADVDCVGGVCPVREPEAEVTAPKIFGPKFGIYGSRTVGTVLMPNLLRGYAKSIGASFEIEQTEEPSERIVRLKDSNGQLRAEIFLQTKGSGSAFKAIAAGDATIGMADRRMKDSDLEKLVAAGMSELRDTENEIVLGVDGIVLITHPDNPVRDLSSLDVARIFSGEITNWLELGGGDYPITVNSFGTGSGDRAVLMDALVSPNGRQEKEDVVRWKAYQDMVDAVMQDRGGIGYSGRWLAEINDVNVLAVREACGLLSPPTAFRMKIEGYSLSRRIYAYTPPGEIHPVARDFLRWARSDAAQPYIKESHFIDADLERMQLHDMGMMMIHTAAVEPDFSAVQYIDMMRELRTADRLSISFRFQTGSSILDVESVRNLRRLAERMEKGEFNGYEVLLVGFADAIGSQRRNTQLAQARADAVRAILSDALPRDVESRLKLRTLSYGELLPLSCNGNDVGRARNRRVEVWLRNPTKLVSGR